MARHNRSGDGVDQNGASYTIDYQPDWLRRVKVTRKLKSGRQSTKNLFRNPSDHAEAEAGDRVRTSLVSPDQAVDFEIAIRDPNRAIRSVSITYELDSGSDGSRSKKRTRRKKPDRVVFTLETGLKPPPKRR